MKPDEQAELIRLRNEYETIRQTVQTFGRKLDSLEQRISEQVSREAVQDEKRPPVRVQPPPLPHIPDFEPVAPAMPAMTASESLPPQESPDIPTRSAAPEPEPANFEMKLATYWFVRIGVVLLLTGLSFFGYFAYKRVILDLNAWGKLGAIGLMGGLLVGSGSWCERRLDNEKLRTFGRVLFGGGLATFYFMLYAAHHIPHLRVVPSAVVDGALLFGWAGFIVWLADRRRSEVLALFAIGLSYYTSAVSQLGIFTLASNLILTTASVVFLVRHRWAVLSLASMIATYLGYAFWRFYQGPGLAGMDVHQLWLGVLFLTGCWLVLLVGAFTRRTEGLDPVTRAAMLVLNNSFFYGCAALTFVQFNRESFWWFSLVFGVVCTVLSVFANRHLREEPIVRHWLLGQGVLFVTIGFIERFSGISLGLILSVEALALMLVGQTQNLRLLRAAAYVLAVMGTFSAMQDIQWHDWRLGLQATGVGSLLVTTGWFVRRHSADERWLATQVTFWCTAALALWVEVLRLNLQPAQRPIVLGGGAVLMALTLPWHRLRPLAAVGQIYLIVAQCLWVFDVADTYPAWVIAGLIAFTFLMAYWWQHQQIEGEERLFPLGLLALMTLVMGITWLQREWAPDQRILATAVVGLLTVIYGVITRWWALAILGQVIIGYLGLQFLAGMGEIEEMRNLVPVITFVVFGAAVNVWAIGRDQEGTQTRPALLANVYYALAALMSILWIHQYRLLREHVWMEMTLAFVVFLGGWKFNRRGALLVALLFASAGFCDFWLQKGAPVIHWANLAGIAAPLVAQQLLRRKQGEFLLDEGWHLVLTAVSGVSIWLFVSEWAENRMLTASWTALAFAFLAGGLGVKERAWRWLGLVMLACAIGRAIFVDVWKLGVEYRVLSFMGLGVALIVLGFIYTRYQEKIKKWL